ncbi:hypothetical protein LFT45_21485 [Arthrobacter sp. FW305-BF8]|uniref:hypothetical protein n=1 Tax=Arthrobacter sp. FW305-BF8 TaxID=2879617 RepID=UPI001F360C29|nr:hypothetical protein [Arthrobacter sp. FW305-BF8]UKA54228.1 hypothetical protein LFT45_21485 [Arthrobacter sp. FW305-BF8]
MDIAASHHRLKVMVRIDANMERACIEVRGTLTPANIRALYVVARRARTLMPGKEIVLDLSMARAALDTITALHDPAHLTQLSGEGTSEKPCRLSILDPRPGIHAHPSFTHGRGDHKHPDGKHPDGKHPDHQHGDHKHPDGKHKDKAGRTQERKVEPSTARSRTARANEVQATAVEAGTVQPSPDQPRVALRRRARDKEPA